MTLALLSSKREALESVLVSLEGRVACPIPSAHHDIHSIIMDPKTGPVCWKCAVSAGYYVCARGVFGSGSSSTSPVQACSGVAVGLKWGSKSPFGVLGNREKSLLVVEVACET